MYKIITQEEKYIIWARIEVVSVQTCLFVKNQQKSHTISQRPYTPCLTMKNILACFVLVNASFKNYIEF